LFYVSVSRARSLSPFLCARVCVRAGERVFKSAADDDKCPLLSIKVALNRLQVIRCVAPPSPIQVRRVTDVLCRTATNYVVDHHHYNSSSHGRSQKFHLRGFNIAEAGEQTISHERGAEIFWNLCISVQK